MAAVRLLVRGLVQGVGFRWFTREAGRRCDLAGWVRNLPDGAVEIAASGDPESLHRFVAAVRHGPPGARVDRIDTLPLGAAEELDRPFAVRRGGS
jgi:acylphosphatase